ncbi:hypothetical protein TNIN_196981 [Trichonephila inaurata madagascariensis]|uniref:Uncharacterized protein n=1 Tax=Trichonephila inaurata madagascariensis TaxID=2747483 RepID=A0A8X6YDK0_9ARAC|nr:hypothetical protein TNIN_196981 [Trichonephila inaurata madagascariensis]
MEPKSSPTLNVNNECFQSKQIISYVETFENERREFVGHSKGHTTVLLSTALVYCQNNHEEVFPLRALLDCGSQKMGHIEEVVVDEDSAAVYYLPHHAVYSDERKRNPLREVFNASPITSGESLISSQLNGGVIQRDLFSQFY